jgi:hypothetical protein
MGFNIEQMVGKWGSKTFKIYFKTICRSTGLFTSTGQPTVPLWMPSAAAASPANPRTKRSSAV